MNGELMVFLVIIMVILAVSLVGVAWAMRGLATRAEVKDMETGFENKFREERTVARVAQGNLHKRIDDISSAVNKTAAGVEILLADRKND